MNIDYTVRDYKRAGRDVLEVYDLAERGMRAGCIPFDAVQLRNAFQVFRYAFREWALNKGEGVVLRALMYKDLSDREVNPDLKEAEIWVDDPEVGEAIERLLRRDGYEEDC